MAKLVGARVYNNAHINVNNTTATKLTFNSEHYDTDSIHDTGSNPGRLTCQTAGKYHVTFVGSIQSDADGIREVYILLNNATRIAQFIEPVGAAVDCRMAFGADWECEVGDYFEVEVYHNAGNALNVLYHGPTHFMGTDFMMHRIG